MKNLILLLINSFLFIGCATWNKKNQVNEEKKTESTISNSTGISDVKINRSISDFSQTLNGKMNFSILPGAASPENKDSDKCNQPTRTVKVKDALGNEAEVHVNQNDKINFGSEINSETKVKTLQESISALEQKYNSLQHEFSNYKKSQETESEKKGLQFGAYLTIFGWGVVIIVLIVLLIYFGKITLFKK